MFHPTFFIGFKRDIWLQNVKQFAECAVELPELKSHQVHLFSYVTPYTSMYVCIDIFPSARIF